MALSEIQNLLKNMAISAVKDAGPNINLNQLAKSAKLNGDDIEKWLNESADSAPTQDQFMAMQKIILCAPKALYVEEQMLNYDEIDTQADLIEQAIESDQMKPGWHLSFTRSLKRIVNECRNNLSAHESI